MNPANAVTLFRIFLTPIIFILFTQHIAHPNTELLIFLWVLFLISEASDVVDGMLARGLGLTSDLGKVLDPFADVISRLTLFLALFFAGTAPLWLFLIVMYRELSMTFLRLMFAQKGISQGASMGGKVKAWLYFLATLGGMSWYTFQGFFEPGTLRDALWWCGQGLYIAAAGLSVITFAHYFYTYIKRTSIR